METADAFNVLDERLAKYIRKEWLIDDEKKVIQVLPTVSEQTLSMAGISDLQ